MNGRGTSATRRRFLSGAIVAGAATGGAGLLGALGRGAPDGAVPVPTSTSSGSTDVIGLTVGTQLSSAYENVRDHGAVGDGSTDDTAAIDKARQASGAIFFPPGTYRYSGGGLAASGSQGGLDVLGAGRNATMVVLGDGKSLITHTSGALGSLRLSGLTVSGGYGAVRVTSRDASVALPLVVEGCFFADYTGAAISSLSADQPYWQVIGNTFKAKNDASTVGVALLGNNNQSIIENNAFLVNACHIKLGGTGGSECRIEKNDFIRFTTFTSAPRTDLWVETSGKGPRVGAALTIVHNKFGAENCHGRDHRVLFADSAGGSDPAVSMPALDKAATSGVANVYFSGNNLAGASDGGTPSFIRSTAKVSGLTVADLVLDGSAPPFVLEFLNKPGDDQDVVGNTIGPLLGRDFMVYGDWAGFRYSNVPGTVTAIDPSGRAIDPDGSTRLPGAGDPAGFRLISSGRADRAHLVDARSTPNKDAFGGPDAADLVFSSTSSAIYFDIDPSKLRAGETVFLEFDAKPASSSAVKALRVVLSQDGSARWGQSVALPTSGGWRRYRLVHVPRPGATSNQFMIGPAYAQKGAVSIGRVRAYAASEPVNVDGRAVGPVIAPGGVVTKVVDGTPADADAPAGADGALVVGGGKLWVRLGGRWRSVTLD